MTCAACAARVEKKLGKLDGVHATVNYATATALVTAPADLPVQALTAAVEQAGYAATVAREHGHRRGRRRSGGRQPSATRPGTSPTCAAG